MGEFRASNGGGVKEDEHSFGFLVFDGSNDGGHPNSVLVSGRGMDVLREFFLAERDTQLGRWRWPEMFGVVAYPQPDGSLKVLDEMTLSVGFYRYRSHATVGNSLLARAARAYFEAHPEPKPWLDAKPGEVWLLTIDGDWVAPCTAVERAGEVRFFVQKHMDELATWPVRPAKITAGRRIWPESADV